MSADNLSSSLQVATQLRQSGRIEQAMAILQQVLRKDPGNFKAAQPLLKSYKRKNMNVEAVELAESVRQFNPDNPDVLSWLGPYLAGYGEFEAAKKAFRKALELQPDNYDLYLKIAIITNYTTHSDEIQRMEDLYDQAGLSKQQRRPLAYALGKIFDDLKSYDRAFAYFVAGNRIARQENDYSIDKEAQDYRLIQNRFDKKYFENNTDSGIDDDTAIFIIGMPRSGTTLVERVLASHPLVYGGGELAKFTNIIKDIGDIIGKPFPFRDAILPKDILQKKAGEYVKRLKNISNNKPYITNKNLANGIYIGMAKVMLPNAKFIFCKRDPRDQGLSFFQKDFGNALPYYYCLEELGQHFHIYRKLMEHWDHVIPGTIYPVQYEELVSDPETQIRSLLEYCGLDFDSACLDFYQSASSVSTLSLTQVRQPLNSDSIGRWKKYQRHLQPFLDSLQQHGDSAS